MSEENVEVVRRAAEFWVTRDFSPMTELFDSEVRIGKGQTPYYSYRRNEESLVR